MLLSFRRRWGIIDPSSFDSLIYKRVCIHTNLPQIARVVHTTCTPRGKQQPRRKWLYTQHDSASNCSGISCHDSGLHTQSFTKDVRFSLHTMHVRQQFPRHPMQPLSYTALLNSSQALLKFSQHDFSGYSNAKLVSCQTCQHNPFLKCSIRSVKNKNEIILIIKQTKPRQRIWETESNVGRVASQTASTDAVLFSCLPPKHRFTSTHTYTPINMCAGLRSGYF